jgi:hypothetical protein
MRWTSHAQISMATPAALAGHRGSRATEHAASDRGPTHVHDGVVEARDDDGGHDGGRQDAKALRIAAGAHTKRHTSRHTSHD